MKKLTLETELKKLPANLFLRSYNDIASLIIYKEDLDVWVIAYRTYENALEAKSFELLDAVEEMVKKVEDIVYENSKN